MTLMPVPNYNPEVPDEIAKILAMPPPGPFTWGAGGARISPDELARRREIADAQMQGDYSPVGHWTQGLGRVLDGVLGGLETRRLNKAQEANASYSDQITKALLGGDSSGAASAMVDPYASPEVQGLAKMMWERANPKPVNNDTTADYDFISGKLGQQAADDWLRRKGDPIITTSLPGDRFYSGPASELLAAITGGGGPASGAAGASAPASPNIDFSQFTPEEIAVWESEARRRAGRNIPQGSPTSPPSTLPPDFDFGGRP